MEKDIQKKLQEIYGGKKLEADLWGRRPPTARELEDSMNGIVSYDDYPPTMRDILVKGDSLPKEFRR